jgi:molybdate transport system substrate-binding protein
MHACRTLLRAALPIWLPLSLILAQLSTAPAGASSLAIKVAVAANFTDPIKEIAVTYERATGNKLLLSLGATGQFYAQITQGAPFDILVAADKATPAKAISEGHAVAGTAFTYAVGKLVLFSKKPGLVTGEAKLRDANFGKIAVANPGTAPYGAAAFEVMRALGVLEALQPRIVQGQNIAQTFKFVETGNAEVGFVALSQIAFLEGGSRWVVPGRMHAPIAQDAVLLIPGQKNEAAKAFLAFLKGPKARAVIEKFGYGFGD